MELGLEGKRIVVTASRKTEEMTTLIEKQGGSCLIRPMQGTVFLAEPEMEIQLSSLIQRGADWFLFTTGAGVESMMQIAEKIGVKEALLEKISQAKVAYRGYKTYSALKSLGIQCLSVDEDGTTRGLVSRLEGYDFRDQHVVLQLHGDAAPHLTRFLRSEGAHITELLPYKHIAPETEVSNTLMSEILGGLVDAVCFTTALQVQNLFSYAKEQGQYEQLVQAFNVPLLAVAVGKITAEALEAEGIDRIIVPEHERMGAMMITLSQYIAGKCQGRNPRSS